MIDSKAAKEMADLLARLAWLEIRDAQMDLTCYMGKPIVYVRVYTPNRKARLAEGCGDNMLEAIDDVMEILRKQEIDNGKS
jgi:ribosome-associated translation inhibitor RaiA